MKIYNYYKKHRWGQREYVLSNGARCLMGAVWVCYPRLKDRRVVYRALRQELGLVSAWNDAPDRTKAEVVALCKRLNI